MKTLIKEINNKIKQIIAELEEDREAIKASLNEAQEKIEQKLEEAHTYKKGVNESKEQIRVIEEEIDSLENDLNVLKERFSNKELKTILETGNREINAQIANRQKEIAKQREKINELTEKARMIKDLLESLQKDKDSKKKKLNNLNSAYAYYQKELTRIIEFSEANPNELQIEESNEDEDTSEDLVFEKEPEVIDDKPIFDAISSFEDDEEEIDEKPLDTSKEDNTSVLEEKAAEDEEDNDDTPKEEDFNLFESNNLDDIDQSLDDLFKKDNTELNFKDLNDTIDKEYENIFGSSDDINIPLDTVEEEKNDKQEEPVESVNIFDNDESISPFEENVDDSLVSEEEKEKTEVSALNDISTEKSTNHLESMDMEDLTSLESPDTFEKSDDVEDFFKNNNLDFNNFSEDDKQKLRTNFNLMNYTKTLDILRKNNIKLDYLYSSSSIFNMNHNELEYIISKLLLAGQTTQNISYVLNALSQINSIDLQDVIESYGDKIKDANITDLIIKAKHLKELGGGNN